MQKSCKIGDLGFTSLKTGVYGGKIAGLYDLEETLGRGHFAVVKLARHVFTGEKVAVKVIDKSKLDNVSKAHLFQEVRCMKLVQHPNVVRLYEVIDTATKLYLILELGDGGDLYDYIMRHEAGLNETVARNYFAQIVRAITYCHQLHVVHRDLKPENVVFFEKQGVVKLTDFGFSNKFSPGQKLETSCGSLAYSAPEILLGDSYDAPAVDVWSLGVILYMLVCGQAPFQEANDSETLTMIMDCKYSVPAHISIECKDLIARMLVRAPDKRATLAEIAEHPWFARSPRTESMIIMPLVSREQLSDEDHNLIVQKMVNGNIAVKEEIHECLDKNDYNHITATYFLLAERKLRFKRQEEVSKGKRPENLSLSSNNAQQINKFLLPEPACMLSVPRTPGDISQRSRKCSIVQEDEEEEEISSSVRDDLVGGHTSLNRRGSRSEGRINVALQERLADTDRQKEDQQPRAKAACNIKTIEARPRSAHETVLDHTLTTVINRRSENVLSVPGNAYSTNYETAMPTAIITEGPAVAVPITHANRASSVMKYKTVSAPSPSQQIPLNEILEESGQGTNNGNTSRQLVNRSRYTEHRRTKFHKTRTASCSSSDASDEDNENRKKRAHKINTDASTKQLQSRRDSHDDSSDSQEPGANGSSTRNTHHGGGLNLQGNSISSTNNNNNNNNNKGSGGNDTSSGRKHTTRSNGTMMGRRHKSSRRRNTETRLRESKSLNRITEEQDAINATSNLIVQTTPISSSKPKSFGAKLLGFTMGVGAGECVKRPVVEHYSRKDRDKLAFKEAKPSCRDQKENKLNSNKLCLLNRYLQVQKRIFLPIPNLFGRNKLYKARSCSSLTREKIVPIPSEVDALRSCTVNVNHNSLGSTNSINQNMGATGLTKEVNVVLVKNVKSDLSNMCTHLGPASKCSFC